MLKAGADEAVVFVYGGMDRPSNPSIPPGKKIRAEGEKPDTREPRWVDLTRYNGENYDEAGDERWDDSWDRADNHLLALFDRYHAQVGGKLAVLVYAPGATRLLFTIEGRTVADYFIAEIAEHDSGYHVVELPIKERCLPNFYLQGRILNHGERWPLKEVELEKVEREED